jgi:HJR/Mrr/RecB family endonuclease
MLGFLNKHNRNEGDSFENIESQEIQGFVISVKDICYKKEHHCGEDCTTQYLIKEGTYKKCDDCIVPKVKGSFSCIEVTIQIIATSAIEDEWSCRNDDVKIVSTKGYTYSGKILCKDVKDNRHRANAFDNITKRTKADIVYTFPLLPNGEKVQAVLVLCRETIRFDIIPQPESEEEDEYNINNYRKQDNDNEDSSTRQGEEFKREGFYFESPAYHKKLFQQGLNQLKLLIFKRLSSHLSTSDTQRLEDQIEAQIYYLNLEYETYIESGSEQEDCLYSDFQEEVSSYKDTIFHKKFVEEQRELHLQKVSELLTIDPYDFEYLCSTIMKSMGYYNVHVTPRSNDKGVDITGYINGEMTVAQCKRYRNSVGSPEMQMFIGAIHNAKAKKGIYFTTGVFTKEAIAMAYSNNIILYGREQLMNNLSLIDDYKQETETQSTLWEENDLPDFD